MNKKIAQPEKDICHMCLNHRIVKKHKKLGVLLCRSCEREVALQALP